MNMEKKTYIHPAMAMKAIAEDLMAAFSQNTNFSQNANNRCEEGGGAEGAAKEENFGADEEHKSVW